MPAPDIIKDLVRECFIVGQFLARHIKGCSFGLLVKMHNISIMDDLLENLINLK